MIAVGIIASLAFIGWLIWRAARKKPIKAYVVMYGLSCIAGVFSFAFFLSMDLPKMGKILVCIILGAALIFMAAWSQRGVKPRQA
ncbi:MAG: hypothetical protein KAW81_01900 [Dehalococcoidia bacterium]|nr:hypothetical protein [Dehalococcoidia bacterium]